MLGRLWEAMCYQDGKAVEGWGFPSLARSHDRGVPVGRGCCGRRAQRCRGWPGADLWLVVSGKQCVGWPAVRRFGAEAEDEEVAEVAHPACGDPAPAFDSITGAFGGPFNEARGQFDQSPFRMSPSVTIGGGYVYVATGRYNTPFGKGMYMYSTGEGYPGNPNAPVGALCKLAQRSSSWKPDGITYDDGRVYV